MAYFPNGSAGEHLENQCDECIHAHADDVGCPIAHVQTEYNYSQLDNDSVGMEALLNTLINEKGDCQMKPLIDRFYNPKVDPRQHKLF